MRIDATAACYSWMESDNKRGRQFNVKTQHLAVVCAFAFMCLGACAGAKVGLTSGGSGERGAVVAV
jgi:hypothetical protein